MSSCGVSNGLDASLCSGLLVDKFANASASGFDGRGIVLTWTDKPIISTIISAYASRLEKQSM